MHTSTVAVCPEGWHVASFLVLADNGDAGMVSLQAPHHVSISSLQHACDYFCHGVNCSAGHTCKKQQKNPFKNHVKDHNPKGNGFPVRGHRSGIGGGALAHTSRIIACITIYARQGLALLEALCVYAIPESQTQRAQSEVRCCVILSEAPHCKCRFAYIRMYGGL